MSATSRLKHVLQESTKALLSFRLGKSREDTSLCVEFAASHVFLRLQNEREHDAAYAKSKELCTTQYEK